ncbi:MAG: ribosome silencing factor [Cyanobacteria bacterium J06638_22]
MTQRSSFEMMSAPATPSAPQDASPDHTVEGLDLALTIAQAADDRKAKDIVILKVTDVSYLADYFVIVSGLSMPQLRAIANSIEQQVEDAHGRAPLRTEGETDGNWLLIDYGDVIAHVFMPEEREYYGLEAFWGHAERVPFEPSAD